MAKLDNYNGSIELISGITQKNNQDFPLMDAHSVQVDEAGKRLDEKLNELADMGITEADKAQIVEEVLQSDVIQTLNEQVLGDGTDENPGMSVKIQEAIAATEEVKNDVATNLYQLAVDDANPSIVYLYRDYKDAEVIPPDQEDTNVISQIEIIGGGGGAAGGAKISLDKTLCSPFSAISLYGKDAFVKFAYKFMSYNEEGEEDGALGNCKAIVSVNGVQVADLGLLEQNTQHTFNVKNYLRNGSNEVILKLSGEYTNADGELATKNLSTKWTVNNINMYVTSTFKDTVIQTGAVTLTYTPYGNLEKTIYFELDGTTENINPVVTSQSDIPRTLTIPANLFSHGSHLLKIYPTATITDVLAYIGNADDLEIDEETGYAKLTGNALVFDIMWAEEGNTTPIIKCAYDMVTITQYNTTDFQFAVYTPGSSTSKITIAVNEKVVQTLTVEGTENQIWSYRPAEIGTFTVTLTTGNVSKQFIIKVEPMDIEISEETSSLKMDFNPIGRSNADENYNIFEYRPTEDGIETGEVYTMSVSDNFDWHNGGWQKDENGESVFCVKAGTWMELDYPLFKSKVLVGGQVIDPVRNGDGKNFKLTFKAKNCKDFDSNVMSCFLEGGTSDGDLGIEEDTDNTKSTGIGIVIKSQKATLSSSVKAMTVPYIDEEKIEFEVNLTNADNYREILMLLDADYSKGDVYDASAESFVQTTPQPIHFGSENCDVYIYRFKAYDKSLTDAQIINNHILEKQNSDEMIAEYQRNQILTGQLIDPELLAKTNPDLRILKITCDHFPTSKDKVTGCKIQQIYKNGRPEDNWTVTNGMIRGQGTSSMEYKTSALNIDIEGDEFHWIGEDGLDHYSTYYQMSPNDIGEKYFNIKVNVASSENANNSQNADDYNNNQPYLRPCRRGGYMLSENLDGVELEPQDVSSKVRDTMKFYPCVIFVEETGDTPTYFAKNEDGTSQMYFYACGDFGNSKKNSRAFGIDTVNNPKECIVEIANNDSLSTRFKTTQLTWKADWEKFADGLEFRNITKLAENDSYYENWCRAAAQRLWSWVAYTDTTYSEETGEQGRSLNTVLTEFYTRIQETSADYFNDVYEGKTISELVAADILKIGTWGSFTTDTVEYRKAKFINEFEEYFEPLSALYHYVYTERHTMIDNRAKNVFPHTEDGIIWDFTFGYDMDTAKGNDNTGYLTYDYGVEDTDRVNNADETSRMAFNAADSVLWCNIRDLMFERVAAMFADREGQGAWDSARLINKFESYQAVKPIRLVMTDMRMKYLRPYEWRMDGYKLVASGVNTGYSATADFIPRMLGTKKYQRRYFEKYQEAYMSSKYALYHNNSTAEKDNIPVRIGSTSSTTIEIVPYAKIYVNLKMGNNTFNFRKKAEKNEVVSITLPSAGGDTEAEILSASLLKQLNNLSALKLRTIDIGKASKLQKLELGSAESSYSNPNLTTVSFGENTMLEYLDVRNCTNLTALTDIEKCIGLKTLYTVGSIVSNLVIANNGLLETAELNAVQVLWLKNLNYLRSLTLTGYTNLRSLIIDNCPYINSYNVVSQATNLTTLRATNVDWSISSDTLLSNIAKMGGIDGNNNTILQSVLTGSVYVAVIGQLELEKFQTIWNELVITYGTSLEPATVVFKNWDGSYLYTDPLDPNNHGIKITKGYYMEDPVAAGYFKQPTRESDEQYHYTFSGWNPSLSNPIIDTLIDIYATYTTTDREYTIEWYRDETESSRIYGATFLYGQEAIYDESKYGVPSKPPASGGIYYLFSGWDTYVPFVNKDLKIRAIWQEATVPTTAKALSDFSIAEIHAIAQDGVDFSSKINSDTESGESTVEIQLGYLPTYDGAIDTTEQMIAEDYIANGNSAKVTDINLFDMDKSWTVAIDFEFKWNAAAEASNARNVLVSCFDLNTETGFMLYNTRNGQPQIVWGDLDSSSTKVSVGTAPTKTANYKPDGVTIESYTYSSTRDMIVLRHIKGERFLYVYFNNRYSIADMNISKVDTSSGIIMPFSEDIRLTLGGRSYADGASWATSEYAVGTLHYVKLWNSDLGEDECKKIATWIYEKQIFQYTGPTIKYNLTANANKYTHASFIAKDLLDGKMTMGTASTGGFDKSNIQPWLQQKFMKAMPVEWRQMLLQVRFKNAEGYDANITQGGGGYNQDLVTSNSYIYLPAICELGYDPGMPPYSEEGAAMPISWMGEQSARIKSLANGEGEAFAYWTSSIDNTSSTGNWWRVNKNGSVAINDEESNNWWNSQTGNLNLGICPCFSI